MALMAAIFVLPHPPPDNHKAATILLAFHPFHGHTGFAGTLGAPGHPTCGMLPPLGSHPASTGLFPGGRANAVAAPGRARHHPSPCSRITPQQGRKGAIVCPDPVLALPTTLKAGSLLLKAVTAWRACSGSQASGSHAGIQRPGARLVA